MPTALPPQRPFADRCRQIALFEAGGLLIITPAFAWFSGVPIAASLAVLATSAALAAVWNGLFNTVFDWLEGRFTGRTADKRPILLRIAHALGFEGGLLLMTLPLIVGITGMAWVDALMADIGVTLAYVLYTFCFNFAYDRICPIAAVPRG